jgi:hypothetical protein
LLKKYYKQNHIPFTNPTLKDMLEDTLEQNGEENRLVKFITILFELRWFSMKSFSVGTLRNNTTKFIKPTNLED